MDDARARRDHPQVAEGGLGPAQQAVALAVALVLPLDVEGEGARRAEGVDLDRVVDDQVGRDERVDRRRVAAQVHHRIPHRREVDHRRDAGEVLEDDPRGHERDLDVGQGARSPAQERLDVLGSDDPSAGVSERVLEKDPDGHRQAAPARPRPTRGRPGGSSPGDPVRATFGRRTDRVPARVLLRWRWLESSDGSVPRTMRAWRGDDRPAGRDETLEAIRAAGIDLDPDGERGSRPRRRAAPRPRPSPPSVGARRDAPDRDRRGRRGRVGPRRRPDPGRLADHGGRLARPGAARAVP